MLMIYTVCAAAESSQTGVESVVQHCEPQHVQQDRVQSDALQQTVTPTEELVLLNLQTSKPSGFCVNLVWAYIALKASLAELDTSPTSHVGMLKCAPPLIAQMMHGCYGCKACVSAVIMPHNIMSHVCMPAMGGTACSTTVQQFQVHA